MLNERFEQIGQSNEKDQATLYIFKIDSVLIALHNMNFIVCYCESNIVSKTS